MRRSEINLLSFAISPRANAKPVGGDVLDAPKSAMYFAAGIFTHPHRWFIA